MEDGCSRMMGKSEGFLKMRETEREKKREKNERKVRETLQNIYAQANLRDIYIYIYIHTEEKKASGEKERALLEGSCRRGGYCIIPAYGRSRTMFMRKTRG